MTIIRLIRSAQVSCPSCLQVAVKVDYADGPIGSIDTPQKWKSDGMITTKGDDSRQRPTLFRRAFSVRMSRWSAIENTVVALFDLLNRVGIVIARNFHQRCVNYDDAVRTYEVTGISPQSRTVAQLSKGFASRGTLYPPLKRTFREPCPTCRVSS